MSEQTTAPSATVKRLEVTVQGFEKPFKFTVVLPEFMGFQREAQRDAGMATNNFLLRTVTQPKRDELMRLFEADWGLPGIIMEQVANELVNLRTAHAKNSDGA